MGIVSFVPLARRKIGVSSRLDQNLKLARNAEGLRPWSTLLTNSQTPHLAKDIVGPCGALEARDFGEIDFHLPP